MRAREQFKFAPKFCDVDEPVESVEWGLTGQSDVKFAGQFDKFFTDKNVVENFVVSTLVESAQGQVDRVEVIAFAFPTSFWPEK